MATPKYPLQYDDDATTSSAYLPVPGDSTQLADLLIRVRSSVVAIEHELGIKPSGAQATVAARLDLIEAGGGGTSGGGESIHRIQIADRFMVDSVLSDYTVIGQVSMNAFREAGMLDFPSTTASISYRTHVYVEKDVLLSVQLYHVTATGCSLINSYTFNNQPGHYGGHFSRETPLRFTSQIPLTEGVYELRARQIPLSLPSDPRSIIWDSSFIMISVADGYDGYAANNRYVEPTDDDWIVWKFNEEPASPFDTFVNDGIVGTSADAYYASTPAIAHVPGYRGMFENGALLIGDDMPTRDAYVEPADFTLSMWIQPVSQMAPGTTFGVQKVDASGNSILRSYVDGSGLLSFEYLGDDYLYHSFTSLFEITSPMDWTLIGFVKNGSNVYISVNGNYQLCSASAPEVHYEGPFDIGVGSWLLKTSNMIIDDVRIATVARSESWFRDVYSLAINQN